MAVTSSVPSISPAHWEAAVLDDPSLRTSGTPAAWRWSAQPRPAGQLRWRPELAGYLTVTAHVAIDKRGTYRLFVCPAHTRLVNDPQPMSAEDQAELEHRREQERLALDGKRYERVRPL
jgi:hypothetical protein